MSLASQAIQEVEAKVSDRLKAHEQAVKALKEAMTEQVTAAQVKSQADLVAYKSTQQEQLTKALADHQALTDEETRQAVEVLTGQIAQKESELVASILEEVHKRYGSL